MPISPLLWVIFIIVVIGLLALDLGVLHKGSREMSFKDSAKMCVFWVGLALGFNYWIYLQLGSAKALEFLTGYIIEQALSIDNIFVFLVLFSFFSVPEKLRHRVLFYGILGAILMRGLFVFIGSELLTRFQWTIYVFGAILIVSGIKLLKSGDEQIDPLKNPIVKLFRRIVPITEGYREQKFFVHEQGRLMATPLCLVLVAIEVTDLVFAVDSVPAVFAITRDPFIVFTSNICAILGLRSYFFLLAGALSKIAYLKIGLSLVLVFVGCKMVLAHIYHIPILLSLGIIVTILAGSILVSWLKPPSEKSSSHSAH